MFIKNERFYPNPRAIAVAGGTVIVPPLTLIVWASLTREDLPQCPAGSRRFPVVVDTGFVHNMLIQESQARDWAGPAAAGTSAAEWHGYVADASGYKLLRRYNRRFEGISGVTRDCPAFEADLWLHSKEVGGKSMRLELPEGFALCPAPTNPTMPPGPTLPLLGGQALFVNDMKVVADYKNLDFSLDEQV